MIGLCLEPAFLEIGCNIFGLFLTEAVDDPGIVPVLADIICKKDHRVFLRDDPVLEIFPVETADKFPGSGQTELLADIPAHFGNCCCGQCHKRNCRKDFFQLGQLPVFRPEVVAPFRDAVRFINRDEMDRGHL